MRGDREQRRVRGSASSFQRSTSPLRKSREWGGKRSTHGGNGESRLAVPPPRDREKDKGEGGGAQDEPRPNSKRQWLRWHPGKATRNPASGRIGRICGSSLRQTGAGEGCTRGRQESRPGAASDIIEFHAALTPDRRRSPLPKRWLKCFEGRASFIEIADDFGVRCTIFARRIWEFAEEPL